MRSKLGRAFLRRRCASHHLIGRPHFVLPPLWRNGVVVTEPAHFGLVVLARVHSRRRGHLRSVSAPLEGYSRIASRPRIPKVLPESQTEIAGSRLLLVTKYEEPPLQALTRPRLKSKCWVRLERRHDWHRVSPMVMPPSDTARAIVGLGIQGVISQRLRTRRLVSVDGTLQGIAHLHTRLPTHFFWPRWNPILSKKAPKVSWLELMWHPSRQEATWDPPPSPILAYSPTKARSSSCRISCGGC
mmetsp:Transcript_2132/g.6086  ORF Transcript_2132/g.6086 Transcript_2132/m.6086 type:complete len:243 (+) Transcript_2132:87-815(+)